MKTIVSLILLSLMLIAGCTEGQRAKQWGGNATSDEMPCGKKVVTVTWKGDDLWILTRELREGEPVEDYTFTEDSSWGILNGTVKLKERACY